MIHDSTADYLTSYFPPLNQSGYTALILAVENGNESLVTLLLGYGADTNLANTNVRHYMCCVYMIVYSFSYEMFYRYIL
jgi:ankyrin repeat protein